MILAEFQIPNAGRSLRIAIPAIYVCSDSLYTKLTDIFVINAHLTTTYLLFKLFHKTLQHLYKTCSSILGKLHSSIKCDNSAV